MDRPRGSSRRRWNGCLVLLLPLSAWLIASWLVGLRAGAVTPVRQWTREHHRPSPATLWAAAAVVVAVLAWRFPVTPPPTPAASVQVRVIVIPAPAQVCLSVPSDVGGPPTIPPPPK